jgi:hypothetical protein
MNAHTIYSVSQSHYILMISGFYWYTAGGQILDAHQDKKGALAISPTIVIYSVSRYQRLAAKVQ